MLYTDICHQLAGIAQKSILYEVSLSPKPGLVDPISNGSHKDMDLFTFISSSTSLYEYFYLFVEKGICFSGQDENFFPEIRLLGIEAEKKMYTSTNQINTHKGIVFSFGIILAACGRLFKKKHVCFSDYQENYSSLILKEVQNMVQGPLLQEFNYIKQKKLSTLTNGEKLFVLYGIEGIRGEALRGYPTVQNYALPFLKSTTTNNDISFQLLKVLLLLISITEDSNIISRSSKDMLLVVQKEAKKTLQAYVDTPHLLKEKLCELDRQYIMRNISPGGSADLLAVTIFFALLEKIIT